MNYIQEIVPTPGRDKIWIVLLFIGSLGTIYRPLASVAPDYAIFAAAIIIVLLYARDVRRRVKIEKRDGLPETTAAFDPFHVKVLWRRDTEVSSLRDLILKEANSHILVTGASGAGKSKLVRELLEERFQSDAKISDATKAVLISSDRYESPLASMLQRLPGKNDDKDRLIGTIQSFLQKNRCSIQDVFDLGARDRLTNEFSHADAVWNRVSSHLSDNLPKDQTVVFAFDQLERIVHSIRLNEKLSQDENGFEIYFLVRLVEHFRSQPAVRTVFVVRGEYFYRCLDFLEKEVPLISGINRVATTHFICPGINTISDETAVQHIIGEFETAPTIEAAGNFLVQDYRRIARLRSRTFSNTFMIRLIGYIIINFYHTDHVKEMIRSSAGQEAFLQFYFECLFHEFAKQNKRDNAIECLKVTIFTIATENRIAGRAIDLEMLVALAHLPEDMIREAASFLLKRGLLIKEGPAYRLAHDIISDYAIGSEQFSSGHPAWPRLKDAIRGLSEGKADKNRLTPLYTYANPIEDLVRRWLPNAKAKENNLPFVSSLSLFGIWLFYLYGASQVLDPHVCQTTSDFFRTYIWAARECEFVSQVYIAIYVTHVVWVTFIYYVTRNFLNLTIKSGWARVLSQSMPLVGAILGIVLSHSPSLFLVPILSVGFVMGGLLCLGVKNGWYVGRGAEDCQLWGIRTAVNMIISSAMIVITIAILHPSSAPYFDQLGQLMSEVLGGRIHISGQQITVTWVYFLSAAMVFFWWHIRPEQQTAISFASRLALRDRTHQDPQ